MQDLTLNSVDNVFDARMQDLTLNSAKQCPRSRHEPAWLLHGAGKSLRVGRAVDPHFGRQADGGPNRIYATGLGVFTANLSQDIGGAGDAQSAQVNCIRNLVASGGGSF